MERDILAEIVERRKADIARLGMSFGLERPVRNRPLHPFIEKPGTILEVKRSSPSKGNIAMGLDPTKVAGLYAAAGTSAISVLTEGNYFHGSLTDLLKVEAAAPDCAILRKDFLLYPEEVDVAYDFGADAVLLIARILSDETLLSMAARARKLGMTPFVEVRTEDDLRKLELVQRSGVTVAGVNARDLRNFHIDPLIPAAFRHRLGDRAVFESGVQCPQDAAFARRLGFEGVLIGEACAKAPESAADFVKAFLGAKPDGYGRFWKGLSERREALRKKCDGKPLAKVCGITILNDALLAAELGADLLGFVFYKKSPRQTNRENARAIILALKKRLGASAPLCVGVVADDSAEADDAIALAKEGVLDAVQFHGRAVPPEIEPADFGYYPAVRVSSLAETNELVANYRHSLPRTLIDAYVPGVAGGTGKRISAECVDAAREKNALWLAGGISPENIEEIVERFEPELVDLSSSLEKFPGKKDPEKLHAFFRAIRS